MLNESGLKRILKKKSPIEKQIFSKNKKHLISKWGVSSSLSCWSLFCAVFDFSCFHLMLSGNEHFRERTFISTTQLPFNHLYQEIMLCVLLKKGFHLSRSSPPERYAHLSGPASSKVDEPKVQGTHTVRFLWKG